MVMVQNILLCVCNCTAVFVLVLIKQLVFGVCLSSYGWVGFNTNFTIIIEKVHSLLRHGRMGVPLLSCYGNRMKCPHSVRRSRRRESY